MRFCKNRKFAIFAKCITGMAAGYFAEVKGGLLEMDSSRFQISLSVVRKINKITGVRLELTTVALLAPRSDQLS